MVKTSWLKYYEPGSEPARFGFVAQSWDTANKSGELNDFSVCTTWGMNGTDIYLLDVFRRRLNFPDLKRAVVQLYSQYRPHVVIVEDKASGTQLIHELQRECGRIKPYVPPPGNDKMMRLHRQTICFENGRVFLRKGAHWLQDYVAELTGFPGTKFDDQVDSTTQFLDYWGNRKPPLIITKEVLRLAAMPGPRSHRYVRTGNPFLDWR